MYLRKVIGKTFLIEPELENLRPLKIRIAVELDLSELFCFS